MALAERLGALVLRAAQTATRIAGIDPGSRFVGLALSSADLRRAEPLCALDRASPPARLGDEPQADWHARELRALLAAERVSALVVGLPLDALGNEGEPCAKVRRYVAGLRLGADSASAGLPVVFLDERYTSAVCRHAFNELGLSAARQQRAKDTGAACVILQNALEIAYETLREKRPAEPAAPTPASRTPSASVTGGRTRPRRR
jgi:putative Holliday junction resolvase